MGIMGTRKKPKCREMKEPSDGRNRRKQQLSGKVNAGVVIRSAVEVRRVRNVRYHSRKGMIGEEIIFEKQRDGDSDRKSRQ